MLAAVAKVRFVWKHVSAYLQNTTSRLPFRLIAVDEVPNESDCVPVLQTVTAIIFDVRIL